MYKDYQNIETLAEEPLGLFPTEVGIKPCNAPYNWDRELS